MKIAIIAPEVFPVPPIRGGAVETIIEEVGRQFKNAEVHILSIADPELPDFEKNEGRVYHRKRWNILDLLALSSWKLPFKKSSSKWYYWPYSRWAAECAAKIKPDVIWVHSRIQFVPWIRWQSPDARLILSLHNESNLKDPEVWTEEAIQSCDVITSCSQSLAEEAVRKYPAIKSRSQVLYNGVDPEHFKPYWEQSEKRAQLRKQFGFEKECVILYAGRLVEEKGVHLLLEALQKMDAELKSGLKKKEPALAVNASSELPQTPSGGASSLIRDDFYQNPFQLVIAGGHTFSDNQTTPYIQKLKQSAQSLGTRVKFVGHISRAQMADYFLMSDILAFPSIWKEPFGMTLLEGMAAGLPAVAFNQGGPAEIMKHRESGLLVPPAEGAQGFRQALDLLIHHPGIREALGRDAAERARKRFSWQQISEDFIKLCGETRKAKARILIAESGSGYGGTAKYLASLLPLLGQKGFDLQVVSAGDGPFIREIEKKGWPVEYKKSWKFPWGEKESSAGNEISETGKFKQLAAAIKMSFFSAVQIVVMVPAIMYWLRKRKIEIVHLNNEVLTHLPLLIAAAMIGAKTVCHLHGWRPFTKIEKVFLPYIDEIVSISQAGAKYYESLLPGWKVKAAPNGISLNGETDHFQEKRIAFRRMHGAANDAQIFLLAGRLTPWKGQEVFLKALASAAAKDARVSGIILGHDNSGGGYLEKLKSMAREMGIESRVRFLPFQEDVWQVYAGVDYVVHASTRPEPFGLVILEAMLAKRPVIATGAGGVLDMVIPDVTGILVAPDSEIPMTQAMLKLMSDPGFARGLAEAAFERAQICFTMERNAGQVAEIYEGLLASARRAS